MKRVIVVHSLYEAPFAKIIFQREGTSRILAMVNNMSELNYTANEKFKNLNETKCTILPNLDL